MARAATAVAGVATRSVAALRQQTFWASPLHRPDWSFVPHAPGKVGTSEEEAGKDVSRGEEIGGSVKWWVP